MGWIRRTLRDIDYHSARRERNVWSIAGDLWFIASLPLALGVVAILAWSVRSTTVTQVGRGTLTRLPNGQFSATFYQDGVASRLVGAFVAGLEVQQEHETRGWPIRVWEQHRRPEIVVNEGVHARVLSFDDADPLVPAVRAAFMAAQPMMAQQIDRPAPPRAFYAAIAGSAAVIWIALIPLGLLMIQLLRLSSGLTSAAARKRRDARRASGRCPRCGYETRGLEYSAACPECGELLL